MDEFKFIETQIYSAVLSLSCKIRSYQLALHELNRLSLFLLDNTPNDSEAIDNWLTAERFDRCPDGFWQSLYRLDQYNRGELPEDSISYSCSPQLAHNGEAHFKMFAHRNIGSFLRDIKTQLPEIEWIYYQDATNMSLQYPYICQKDAITPDFDWSRYHTWLSVCPENNPLREIRWTSPSVDYAGKGVILSVSLPLYREDEFTGLWSIDVPMVSLYTGALDESRISGQSNFISDATGRLIFHPDLSSEIDHNKGSVSQKRLSDIDESLGELSLKDIPSRSILTKEVLFKGKRKHYLFCRAIDELDWIIFSLLPEDRLLSEIDKKISSALSKVKKGDLTYRIEEKGSGDNTDVLRTVIGNFNDMAEALELQMKKNREAQQIAIQSEKLQTIGVLTSGIAHDFNNTLTSILGYTELALQEREENSSLDFYLQTIYTAGVRAKGLIGQILEMSREESSEMVPSNLGKMLEKELILLRAVIPSAIKIQESIDSSYSVMANESLFHRLLINLCVNASHAMPEGGTLRIGIEDLSGRDKLFPEADPGRYVKLTVEDTGTGIPEDIITRIFEPLFTTKPKGKGTGLGLATVKNEVESHKGFIRVNSRLGSGTQFAILFPAAEEKIIPTEPIKRQAAQSAGNDAILLLEDEKSIGFMLKKYLSRLGYKVSEVSTGEAVLQKLSGDSFDLLIMDADLSEQSLKIFFQTLSDMDQKIPMILCIDNGNSPMEEMLGTMGRTSLVYKPIDLNYLVRTISAVLANQENFNRSASTN